MKKKNFRTFLIGLAFLVMALTGCGMQAAENSGNAGKSPQQETEENTASDVPAEVISLDALESEKATAQTGENVVKEDSVTEESADEVDMANRDGEEPGIDDGEVKTTLSEQIGNESSASVTDETGNGIGANAGIESSENALSAAVSSEPADVNYMDASAWENAETYYSNYGYQITIPFEWKDKVSIVETESGTDFICTPAEEENYTGLLFTLRRMSKDEYDEKSLGPQMVTKVAEEGGEVMAAIYPREEIYDAENSFAKESYETAANYIGGVLDSYKTE